MDIAICAVGFRQLLTARRRDDAEEEDGNEAQVPRWKEKVELVFHLVSLDMMFPPGLYPFSTGLGVGSGSVSMGLGWSVALRPHWVWIGRILKIVCLFILGGRIKVAIKPPVPHDPPTISVEIGRSPGSGSEGLETHRSMNSDVLVQIDSDPDDDTWLRSLLGDLNPHRLSREVPTTQYRSIGVQTSQKPRRRVHARAQAPARTSGVKNGGSVSSGEKAAKRGKGVGGLNLRVAGSEERSTRPLTVFKGIEEDDEYRDDKMESEGTEIGDKMDSPRMSQPGSQRDPRDADSSASTDNTDDGTPDERQSTDSSWEEVRHEEHVPTKGVVRGKSGPRSEADEEEDPGHGRTEDMAGMSHVQKNISQDGGTQWRMEEVEEEATVLDLDHVHPTGVDLGRSPSGSIPADLTSFGHLALASQGTSHHGRSTLTSRASSAGDAARPHPVDRRLSITPGSGVGSQSPDVKPDEIKPESSNKKRDADVVESGSEDEETGLNPVGALQSRQSDAGYEYADENDSSRLRAKEVAKELGASAGASTSSINVPDVEFAQDKSTTTPDLIATPEHHPFQPTVIAPLAPLRLSGRRSHGHRQTASQSRPHDHPAAPEREPADVSTYKALQRFRSNLAELDPTFTFDPRHAREGGHRRARTIDVRSSTTVRLDDLLKREEEFEL